VLLRESAADLAQSVCREALVRMRDGELEYRGDQAFQGWLFGAADLKLKNRVRQLSALARAFDNTPPGGDLEDGAVGEVGADTGPSPSAAVARAEYIDAFRAALAELDERQHECVRLFHFEGLSHAEIAARLDVTEGHSRTLLARALARLARLLRERGAHSA